MIDKISCKITKRSRTIQTLQIVQNRKHQDSLVPLSRSFDIDDVDDGCGVVLARCAGTKCPLSNISIESQVTENQLSVICLQLAHYFTSQRKQTSQPIIKMTTL